MAIGGRRHMKFLIVSHCYLPLVRPAISQAFCWRYIAMYICLSSGLLPGPSWDELSCRYKARDRTFLVTIINNSIRAFIPRVLSCISCLYTVTVLYNRCLCTCTV